jgi:hypothetical protein
MTTGKLEGARAPAVVTVMQAAASNGWGLAHCLTDKQLERLIKSRIEFRPDMFRVSGTSR